MKAAMPHVVVPGDNELMITHFCSHFENIDIRPNLMARNGTCMGMNRDTAVWRFGQMVESEAARAYGVNIVENDEVGYGFLWVLATRKTGKVLREWRGYAIQMPKKFRQVIEWEP